MHLTLAEKLQKLHRGSRTNKRPDTEQISCLAIVKEWVSATQTPTLVANLDLHSNIFVWYGKIGKLIRFLIVSSSVRWCYLTWPVGAPSIGLRDYERSAGTSSFAKEAEKEKRGCRV